MISFLATLWINLAWLIDLALFLIVILALNYFIRRLFDRFKARHHLQQSDWRYNLDQALFIPFRVLLWILFAAFVADLVIKEFEIKQISFDPLLLRNIGIVICATWFLFRCKRLVEQAIEARRHSGKHAPDPATVEIIGKIYTIVILFLTILILLENFGLNIAPLLAFGGIGAAALGFASKDVISNLYGGMTIYLSRPFHVNDRIELPQKKLTGTVENIGWYFTTLRDLSKKPNYIPNAVFTTELVVNESRMTHRFINETLTVKYTDAGKLETLIREIRKFLSLHTEIDHQESIYVFVSGFAESSIHLEIKAYTIATRYEEYMDVKQKILIHICEMLEKAGASVGYPVREIHLQTTLPKTNQI